MDEEKKHFFLRKTIKEFLLAAVFELFLDVKPISSKVTDIGFFADFIIKKEDFFLENKDILEIISEKMKELFKEDLKTFQMVPKNAISFVKSLDENYFLIEKLFNIDTNLVDLVQIKNFVNIEKGPFVKDIKFFKLYKFEKIEGKIRVWGALFDKKEKLKQFLKVQKSYEKENNLTIGKEKDLFFSDYKYSKKWIWTERGTALKDNLKNFLKKKLVDSGFSFMELPQDNIENSINIIIDNKIADKNKNFTLKFFEFPLILRDTNLCSPGLFSSEKTYSSKEYILCSKEDILEEYISSLKFFFKIVKIFDFKYKVYISYSYKGKIKFKKLIEGISCFLKNTSSVVEDIQLNKKEFLDFPFIEIAIEDKENIYHREQSIKILNFCKEDEKVLIERSSIKSFEDFIALILERKKGVFPFFINPEQVRVLPVNCKFLEYAKSIEEKLKKEKIRVKIDRESEILSKKVSLAIKEGIEYIVVVGEKEEKEEKISVRGIEGELTLYSFLIKLKKQLGIKF